MQVTAEAMIITKAGSRTASETILRISDTAVLEQMSTRVVAAARPIALTTLPVTASRGHSPVGLQFGALLGGTVIIETVFARQGLGRIAVEALKARDFPVAQGVVLFVALIYVFVNLIVDLLYAVVDPRIRYN